MTPESCLQRIEQAADAAHMEIAKEQVGGRSALVARSSQFRWRWFASRLHTFLIAATFDSATLSTSVMDEFLSDATKYAIEHKGGLPRGLQTGSAAIAVVIVDRLEPDVAEWATSPHGRRWAAIAYPVSVEVVDGTVKHPDRMIIGAVYSNHLKHLVSQVVVAALHDTPEQ